MSIPTATDADLPTMPAPRSAGCPLVPPAVFAQWREDGIPRRAMNLFLGVLTDPFMNRTGGFGAAPVSGVAGYAGQANMCEAQGVFTKGPALTFARRWSVWAAGFGGSQRTNGDPVIVGSNDTRSSVYGTARGADYLGLPTTIGHAFDDLHVRARYLGQLLFCCSRVLRPKFDLEEFDRIFPGYLEPGSQPEYRNPVHRSRRFKTWRVRVPTPAPMRAPTTTSPP